MAIIELTYSIPVVVEVDTEQPENPVGRVTVCDEEIERVLGSPPDHAGPDGISGDDVQEAIRLARENTEWPAWKFGF